MAAHAVRIRSLFALWLLLALSACAVSPVTDPACDRESHVGRLDKAAGNFGVTLVVLGILMLTIGIIYHLQYMYSLRVERKAMAADGLIHAHSIFPLLFQFGPFD